MLLQGVCCTPRTVQVTTTLKSVGTAILSYVFYIFALNLNSVVRRGNESSLFGDYGIFSIFFSNHTLFIVTWHRKSNRLGSTRVGSRNFSFFRIKVITVRTPTTHTHTQPMFTMAIPQRFLFEQIDRVFHY